MIFTSSQPAQLFIVSFPNFYSFVSTKPNNAAAIPSI